MTGRVGNPDPPRLPAIDPLEYLFGLEQIGVKFGLTSIERLCEAIGSPHHAFASVLVAGTNGKGSVTAIVEHALRSAGVRTGRYTSPHLIGLEERFCINGSPVDRGVMRLAAARVQEAIARLLDAGGLDAHPTFFEATTAMAFDLFRQAGVDVAVVEVGLGGRLDSTNILSPVLTAITSIDLDHQALLGSTLEAIAFEKAGIVKPGVPLVLGDTRASAQRVIAGICEARGAPLLTASAGVRTRVDTVTDGHLRVTIETPTATYGPLTLALRGRHQVANAVTAVRILEEMPGHAVPERAVGDSLEHVAWPGRLERLTLAPNRGLLLDSAHNPAGAHALAAYLRDHHADRLPVVFGAMRDKDAAGMLGALASVASAFVITAPSRPRARPVSELARIAREVAPHVPVEEVGDPRAAVERAWQSSPLACVCGSVFLVGHVKRLLARGRL